MALNGAVEATSFAVASTLVKFYPSKRSLYSLSFEYSSPFSAISLKTLSRRKLFSPRNTAFRLCSAEESVSLETEIDESQNLGDRDGEEDIGDNSEKPESRRKLFVLNLPWSLSVSDIKELFRQCGAVSDVEIIKQKDGKNRGFAFVTMSTGEEAEAAIQKFDSYELVGRIIRVQFAKRFKKLPRPDSRQPNRETSHVLYVSNLAWKVRSNNLREFFSLSEFNPVSARVVFDSPSGRSAGYGFVSFSTREVAESAISGLDGKELLGRPVRLKFSERSTTDTSSEGKGEEEKVLVEHS